MKLDFRNNRNFWAGLMFIGIGGSAMFLAQNYGYGSVRRMGPGYFPTLLSVILVALGIIIMIKGLRSNEGIKGRMTVNAWRALIVLPAALMLFGLMVERAGLIPAVLALCFVSAAAGSQFKFVEVLLLTLALTVVSVALFIWGLGLPYPLIAGFN
jgi:hypothetical protein